jgi:hypothetical protein
LETAVVRLLPDLTRLDDRTMTAFVTLESDAGGGDDFSIAIAELQDDPNVRRQAVTEAAAKGLTGGHFDRMVGPFAVNAAGEDIGLLPETVEQTDARRKIHRYRCVVHVCRRQLV